MLACKNCEIGLGQLKRSVLKHAYLVKDGTPLVKESLVVPDTIWLYCQVFKNLLQSTLEHIYHSLVLSIFSLHFLCVLLSALHITHDLFELKPSRGKLILGGVTDSIVAVPCYFDLHVLDVLAQVLRLRIKF